MVRAVDIIIQDRKKVVENIIEKMEKDGLEWKKGWSPEMVAPTNPSSNAKYKGRNVIKAFNSALSNEFKDSRWVTFNQAVKEGWKIKKGAKSIVLEKWIFDKEEKRLNPETGKEEKIKVKLDKPVGNYFRVFNAQDIEGIPPLNIKPLDKNKTLEIAENIIKSSKVPVVEIAQPSAYHSSSENRIVMPLRDTFKSQESYLATALHEMVHSTGKELRRDLSGKFGEEKYAKEELVAELGSLMLQGKLGIKLEDRQIDNHAAYLQGWVKVLKNDSHELFRAAERAEKASELLYERYQEYIKEHNLDLKKENISENSQEQEVNLKQNKEFWRIEFNEYPENGKNYKGQVLTEELLDKLKEMDNKLYLSNEVKNGNNEIGEGTYKFYLEKVENGEVTKNIRLDIGEGNHINGIEFANLYEELYQINEKNNIEKLKNSKEIEIGKIYAYTLEGLKDGKELTLIAKDELNEKGIANVYNETKKLWRSKDRESSISKAHIFGIDDKGKFYHRRPDQINFEDSKTVFAKDTLEMGEDITDTIRTGDSYKEFTFKNMDRLDKLYNINIRDTFEKLNKLNKKDLEIENIKPQELLYKSFKLESPERNSEGFIVGVDNNTQTFVTFYENNPGKWKQVIQDFDYLKQIGKEDGDHTTLNIKNHRDGTVETKLEKYSEFLAKHGNEFSEYKSYKGKNITLNEIQKMVDKESYMKINFVEMGLPNREKYLEQVLTKETLKELERLDKSLSEVDLNKYYKIGIGVKKDALRKEVVSDFIPNVYEISLGNKSSREVNQETFKRIEEEFKIMKNIKSIKNNETFKYYSTERELKVGNYPTENLVNVSKWSEKSNVHYSKNEAWGYVEYSSPLTGQDRGDFRLTSEEEMKKIKIAGYEFKDYKAVSQAINEEKYIITRDKIVEPYYDDKKRIYTGKTLFKKENVKERIPLVTRSIVDNDKEYINSLCETEVFNIKNKRQEIKTSEKIKDVIKENPYISTAEIAKNLKIDEKDIKEELSNLIKNKEVFYHKENDKNKMFVDKKEFVKSLEANKKENENTRKKNEERIKNIMKEIANEPIPRGNYNALTGNEVITPDHSSGDKRWLTVEDIKKHNIPIKENEQSTLTIITHKEEEKLYVKPIEYYNVGQLNISKEVEKQFKPMKEKVVEKSKEKGQGIGD